MSTAEDWIPEAKRLESFLKLGECCEIYEWVGRCGGQLVVAVYPWCNQRRIACMQCGHVVKWPTFHMDPAPKALGAWCAQWLPEVVMTQDRPIGAIRSEWSNKMWQLEKSNREKMWMGNNE